MMEFNDICLICLRTDRKLKTAPAALSKYHNEISKHYIDINKCNYCCICEHLLRKAYKFHQKCLTAAKILKSWENSTTLYKPPIDQLHRKLFPEPLGPWIPNNNNKVYIFDEDSLNVRETNARNSLAPVKVPQVEISPIKIPVVDIKEEVECALEEIIIEDDPQDAIDNIVIKEIKSTLDDTHSIEVVNADIGNKQNAKKNDTNFNTSRRINLKRNIKESELEDDTIYLSDDDSNDDTVDEIKQLDNTSVNNDHDYIAINHTSDDDSEDNDDTTTEVDKTKPQALKFLSTLRTLNEKLEDICQNWDIPALTHMAEDITTEEVRKITREHLANKISRIKFRKRSMQFKMDAIDTDLSTIIDEGKVQVRDFNADMTRREWLIWTVGKKMRAWGELKTEDGRTFDTEGIISWLDKMPQKNIQYLHQYFSDAKSSRILQVEITRILINIEAKLKDDEYSSIFDIQYLTTEKAKIEEFEQRKTYQCYLQAKNRCDKCFLTFINSGLLEYHVKTNHDESNTKYICTICPVRRTSKARIMMHIGLHDEVFRCRFCPLVTYYRKSMLLHYLRHKGESQYHCEKCNKTYGSLSVFRTHNSKYHPRGAHICTICGGSYISHTGLIFHVKRKHPGATKDAMSNELKCKTCNITFASLEEYSKHSRDRHRAIPPERYLKCDYCSLKFGTMKQRNKHAISAHGIKEKDITRKIHMMRCRVCSEEGTSAGWLMMHYSKQHPTVDVSALYVGDKAHLCEICGKGFAHKVYLNDHMNIHNGITYPCPRCNKRFVSMTKLRRHELTHKPPGFACQHCGKKFKSRPNLWSHSKLHIGDRRYKCEICGKGFLLNNALKAHIRGVHKHERRIRKPRLGTRRNKDKKDVAETDEVREAIEEVTEATYEVGETIDEVTEPTYEVGEIIDEGIDATEEFLESTDDEIAETMEEMEVIHEEMEIIDDEEIQYEVLETETEMIDETPDTSYGTITTDTVLFHDIGEIVRRN